MYLRSSVGHLTRYREVFHKLVGPGGDGGHPGHCGHGQDWLQGRSEGQGVRNEDPVPQQEVQVGLAKWAGRARGGTDTIGDLNVAGCGSLHVS